MRTDALRRVEDGVRAEGEASTTVAGTQPKGCFVVAASVMKKRTNQEMPCQEMSCAARSGRQVCRQAEVPGPQVPRNTVSGLVKPMKGQTIQGVAGPALKVNP